VPSKLCRALGAALLAVLVAAGSAGASTEPSRFFGVVAQSNPSEAEFERMHKAGVSTYRMAITWPAVQSSAGGPFDWTGTDRLVADLTENRIEPLPVLYGSPCFVVACDPRDGGQASPRPPTESPQAELAWAGFLGEVVDRYGPGGRFWSEHPSLPQRPPRVWQVWNEPNVPQFYAPTPSVEGYTELLRISSHAIRSTDPGATILIGGLPGDPGKRGSIEGTAFLEGLYGAGARAYFDAVALHPYSPGVAGVRNQLVDVRTVLDAHNDFDTSIWVTELGWGATPSGDGRFVKTIDGQAETLLGAFGLMAAKRKEWNIDRALWYAWRDPPPDQPACSWCRTAGLFDAAGEARPSWAAFTALSTGTEESVPPEVALPPETDDSEDDTPPRWVVVAAAVALCLAAGAFLLLRRSRARRLR
jgi:polysaccharide biosynthesis protein PslG